MTHHDEIMQALEAIRVDVKTLRRDTDDHERRLRDLEPLRDSIRSLIDCNTAIVTALEELRDSQRDLMDQISSRVESSLRSDLMDMRKELRLALAALSKEVRSRPCLLGGECAAGEEA